VDELPTNTQLALERTRFAYERTLMAWVRTALSLISFGFTIYKFFELQGKPGEAATQGPFGVRAFALLMIGIGLTALLLATFEHQRNVAAMRKQYGNVPFSLAAFVALLVGGLGVVGLVSVLLNV